MVKVVLVQTNSQKANLTDGYRRFIDKTTSFDYIEHGSFDTYKITFRIVRFPLLEGSYECLVTNLPADEFPPGRLKKLYFSRWGKETSFRKLKYTSLALIVSIQSSPELFYHLKEVYLPTF